MKKILLLLSLFMLVGCSSTENLYKTISGKEAFRLVNNNDAVIIDVRTIEEYESCNIENSINIPLNIITKDKIEQVVSSLEDNIIVYCRSGNRSKQASQILIDLGYTNVYDLGSIDNWSDMGE